MRIDAKELTALLENARTVGWNDGVESLRPSLEKMRLSLANAHAELSAANNRMSSARLSPEVIVRLWSTDRIECIKAVREVTGLGLKEAKDLVEANTPSFRAAPNAD